MGKAEASNIVTVTAQSINKDDETMAATHGATIQLENFQSIGHCH